jgi:hypothetical protein
MTRYTLPLLVILAVLLAYDAGVILRSLATPASAQAPAPATASVVAGAPAPGVDPTESCDLHALQCTLTRQSYQGSSPDLQGPAYPVAR